MYTEKHCSLGVYVPCLCGDNTPYVGDKRESCCTLISFEEEACDDDSLRFGTLRGVFQLGALR
jgi:hypothetical protein